MSGEEFSGSVMGNSLKYSYSHSQTKYMEIKHLFRDMGFIVYMISLVHFTVIGDVLNILESVPLFGKRYHDNFSM